MGERKPGWFVSGREFHRRLKELRERIYYGHVPPEETERELVYAQMERDALAAKLEVWKEEEAHWKEEEARLLGELEEARRQVAIENGGKKR